MVITIKYCFYSTPDYMLYSCFDNHLFAYWIGNTEIELGCNSGVIKW